MKRNIVPARPALTLAIAACLGLAGLTAPAIAAGCPGNPDALGTSRTIVVDPRAHPRIGTMQYAETLPLNDREVVLTFDDGPLPRQTSAILDTLEAECVKATFFVVGRMAHDFPVHLRRIRDAGHTIGTHTQNHPTGFDQLPIARARQEIDDGIASTTAALGGTSALSPFFRIPGLRRSAEAEDYLASKGLQTWSADFPADDWRHISSDQVLHLALSRLEAKGKGILLLHDIQTRTVDALPRLLQALKARGFKVVHVVAATPDRPATPTEPRQWKMHPAPDLAPVARAPSIWPETPRFVFAMADTLPSPSMSRADVNGMLRGTLPRPRMAAGEVDVSLFPAPLSAMPVPDRQIFQMSVQSPILLRSALRLSPTNERRVAPAIAGTVGVARPVTTLASAARRPIAGSLPVRDPVLERGSIQSR